MKTINWKNAIIAGILGTILFDIVGLLLTGKWWDIPGLLGMKTGLGLAYGVVGHYSNGILLSILFISFKINSLLCVKYCSGKFLGLKAKYPDSILNSSELS